MMDINFWQVLLISAVFGWAIAVTYHLVAIRKRLDQLADKLLR